MSERLELELSEVSEGGTSEWDESAMDELGN